MNYSELIIWQYKQPKAIAEIDMKSKQWIDFMQSCLSFIEMWDVDKAEKYSLDVLGRIFGVSRTSVSMLEKDYLTYYEQTGGKGWGQGRWYRAGESLTQSVKLLDHELRFLIKARILKLFQDPSIDYLTDALQALTGSNAHIVDNGDMTMSVFYGELIQEGSFDEFAMSTLDILPRPVGVMYTIQKAPIKYFGFGDLEFTDNHGYGVGQFIDA